MHHTLRIITKCIYCDKQLQELGFGADNIDDLFVAMRKFKTTTIPHCIKCKHDTKVEFICSRQKTQQEKFQEALFVALKVLDNAKYGGDFKIEAVNAVNQIERLLK